VQDREIDDSSLLIQHGRFYIEDDYPDAELFASAAMLVRRFSPDYLLVHPMGVDNAGELHGSDSPQYRSHVLRQDVMLAALIVEWNDLGYTVLVTGDHGMNPDGDHGGSTPDVREVPLFVVRPGAPGRGNTEQNISQLQIAPTILRWLDVPIPATMARAPLDT
jgi:predicted AlkP superfamily pyrophosphatase or phosphodiesterase